MHAEAQRSAGWRHHDPYPAARNAATMPGPGNAWFAAAAVLAALPCGYCFGVVAAFLLNGGPNVGETPLLTVPVGLLTAVAVALLPIVEAQTRFTIMVVGTIAAAVVYTMVRLAFP